MNITEFYFETLYNYIPIFAFYMEMHYKLKWIGSKYYIQEPEILSDIPYRVEPGKKLPVLLLIKDSDHYPINLIDVDINIYKHNKIVKSYKKYFNIKISQHWWHTTYLINVNDLSDEIEVEIIFNYKIDSLIKRCLIHNIKNCSNNRMSTFISKYPYPNDGNITYGDLHYHTNLTEDMVEFGAPLESTLYAAEAIGLDFYCNTDHSYDLDDKIGSWTETDPDLIKWNNSRNQIKRLNKNKKFNSFIIPSEELSLHNSKAKNIHALIINNNEFLPGAGDGFEKPFNFKSIYNVISLANVLENNALCIAAHPFEPMPLLQKIFFGRGEWEINDITSSYISGLQILNGKLDKIFYKSLSIWTEILLKGYHKYVYAGNDAHGNFNIYRQIKIPMLSIKEKKEQFFGYFRTGVFSNKKNINDTIYQLKNGNCFITNGPLINMTCKSNKRIYSMGSTVPYQTCIFNINIISTPEFGPINNIVIRKGIINENSEKDHYNAININKFEYNFIHEVVSNKYCYFRCEVSFTNNKRKIIALTNPIWIKPDK